mgnify:CR=1 FL=1
MRGGDLVLEQDIDVRVAELPAGEDPDSFIRKHGGQAFQALLDGAASFLDFRAAQLQASGMFSTPEGKARAIRSLVETVSRMRDELKRTFSIKRLAEQYDIYESVLFRELESILGKQQQPVRSSERPVPRATEAGRPAATQQSEPSGGIPPAERDLLKLMLDHGSAMVRYVIGQVEPALFTSTTARRILDVLLRREEAGGFWDAGMIVDDLDDPALKHIVTELTVSRYEISKGWQEMGSDPPAPDPRLMADDCIAILHRRSLDERIAETYRLMRDSELRGEDVTELQQEILRMQRARKETHGH